MFGVNRANFSIQISYRDSKGKKHIYKGKSKAITNSLRFKGYQIWIGKIYDEERRRNLFIKYISENYNEQFYYAREFYQEAKERFKKEENFCLKHPFVVWVERAVSADITELDDNGTELETGKFLCLIEEYAGELSLGEYYRNYRPNEKIMFSHMMQLLMGMCAYSEIKQPDCIIHRDIKPNNIMIMNHQIKYIDFDWAHIDHLMTINRGSLPLGGTNLYQHPMQMQENCDSFIGMDIYALGMVFIYMLKHDHYLPPESLSPDYWKNTQLVYRLNLKYFPKNWVETHKKTYMPLLMIISKMIEQPGKQYSSPLEVLTDFKSFLKKYDQDLFYAILKEMYEKYHILPKTKPEQDSFCVEILVKENDTAKRKIRLFLLNGQVLEQNLTGNLVLTLYRVKEQIYYFVSGLPEKIKGKVHFPKKEEIRFQNYIIELSYHSGGISNGKKESYSIGKLER